jgi:signal transduction histidine kinase
MIEFFSIAWGTHIFVVFILGICVLAQTLVLVLSFFRHGLTITKGFENLLELSIIFEIIVFSLLFGEMGNAYKNGFVLSSGYENLRITIFIIILMLVIIVSTLRKDWLFLTIIPAILISLPKMENVLGASFPWLFILALIYFLMRSITICITSIIAIRTDISALSVVHAMDTLDTGVLFSENDGYTLLSNYQMQNFMVATTGRIFRNAIEFYNMLISDLYKFKYKKAELEGQTVYLLADGTAWMLTKTDISFLMKNYIHISVANVSQLWELTAKLQNQDKELRYKSEELKETIANLHILSKEKEIHNAKMRAHDILGQRLSLLLRIIENEKKLDYDLLISLSKGLIAELKAEQSEIAAKDELENIQNIFSAIGVNIKFDGELPKDSKQARLFVDIIREGSTNAVRHGFATEINMKSRLIDNTYNLTIKNNGHTTRDIITLGSGIRGMKKKVSEQGGNLEIIQDPQFTLSVVLPGGEQYE